MTTFTPPARLAADTTSGHPAYDTASQLARDSARASQATLRAWQMVTLGFSLLAFVGMGGFLVLALQDPATKWVVLEVTENGELRHTTYLPQQVVTPTPKILEQTLTDWLIKFRWVPEDATLHSLHFTEASALMTAHGKALVLPMATERFQMREQGLVVQVQLRSILPMDTSLVRWNLEWYETTVNKSGGAVGPPVLWKGILGLQVLSEAELAKAKKPRNSLGIFINDVQIRPVGGPRETVVAGQ